MNDNIYDTTLYTNYYDLPPATQKSLYNEWLSAYPIERKTRLVLSIFAYIFFGLTLGLLLASAIITYFIGFDWLNIILIIGGIVCIIFFMIISNKRNTQVHDHSIRFSAWLKTEKRVLAELVDNK